MLFITSICNVHSCILFSGWHRNSSIVIKYFPIEAFFCDSSIAVREGKTFNLLLYFFFGFFSIRRSIVVFFCCVKIMHMKWFAVQQTCKQLLISLNLIKYQHTFLYHLFIFIRFLLFLFDKTFFSIIFFSFFAFFLLNDK